MTREELITALEKATEPSRELDAEIARTITPGCFVMPRSGDWIVYEAGGGWDLPPYTSSLDAALTLLPKGWGFLVMGNAAKVGPHPAMGANPAIALCGAILKAIGAA